MIFFSDDAPTQALSFFSVDAPTQALQPYNNRFKKFQKIFIIKIQITLKKHDVKEDQFYQVF